MLVFGVDYHYCKGRVRFSVRVWFWIRVKVGDTAWDRARVRVII